ncbi:hypothetical protein C8R43DRAFT_948057 [Mycena crocata]|nr:hypothetical protein C8R43DRAFT_948057 [Mycena crocata]
MLANCCSAISGARSASHAEIPTSHQNSAFLLTSTTGTDLDAPDQLYRRISYIVTFAVLLQILRVSGCRSFNRFTRKKYIAYTEVLSVFSLSIGAFSSNLKAGFNRGLHMTQVESIARVGFLQGEPKVKALLEVRGVTTPRVLDSFPFNSLDTGSASSLSEAWARIWFNFVRVRTPRVWLDWFEVHPFILHWLQLVFELVIHQVFAPNAGIGSRIWELNSTEFDLWSRTPEVCGWLSIVEHAARLRLGLRTFFLHPLSTGAPPNCLVWLNFVPRGLGHLGPLQTHRLHDVSRSRERAEFAGICSREKPPEANVWLYLQSSESVRGLRAKRSRRAAAAHSILQQHVQSTSITRCIALPRAKTAVLQCNLSIRALFVWELRDSLNNHVSRSRQQAKL